MKSILTKMSELARIPLVGQTDAGSAEVQPARDSQLKATNGRWDGSYTPAIPFYKLQRQFRALLCLKKPSCRRQDSLLTEKWICPIHAEPVHPWQLFAGFLSGGFILLAFGSLFFKYPFAIGFPGLALIWGFSLLILSTTLNTARHPLRGDIIIAVIIIIGIIGNIWGIFWYYYGSAALSDMSDLDWFLLVARPGFVFLFFGFFIYLLIKSFKSDLAPKEFIIRIIFLLLIVIAFLVRPYLYESGQILFLKGLSKAIKNNITVSAIQDWLSQQDIPSKEPDPEYRTPYYLKGVGRILYEPDAQPECVKKFSRGEPIYVLYDWKSKDFYILQAGDSPWTWGFNLGIFQWRVVIGLSTMSLPPLKYQSETVLQFSPGVYGWCDYQNLLFRSDNQKK